MVHLKIKSTLPGDVAIHRSFIQNYNPTDPWRQPNNWVMHPMDYQFGPGQSSPQYIGGMFSQLPGPPFAVNPYMNPYVVFRPF